MSTTYDQALPLFAAILAHEVGEEEVFAHCFLRDADGKLTLIASPNMDEDARERIANAAGRLEPWVDGNQPVIAVSDLFDLTPEQMDRDSLPELVSAADFTGYVRVLERRIVGQDWLHAPRDPSPDLPPIAVFASHKGGVGRSTALAVAAAAFSAQNLNVLVVDLDLEAPGIGDIMLDELPLWGGLDFFVEDSLRELDGDFFDDLTASSPLASRGIVHVAPAIGQMSAGFPQNVLGKIARAYLERVSPDGTVETFLERTRRLLERLCERQRYDVVLVDARAGLNEATAAAILGLGGEILLFGIDTPQTFAGYRFFLSHLAKFRLTESDESDWRYRLRFVHAKARAGETARAHFRSDAFDVLSETLYDEEYGIEDTAFNFDYNEENAPHFAWQILNDSHYTEFNPLADRDLISEPVYARTFGPFVEALTDKLGVRL